MKKQDGRLLRALGRVCAAAAAAALLLVLCGTEVYAWYDETMADDRVAKTKTQFYDEVIKTVKHGWEDNRIIVLFDPADISSYEMRGQAFRAGGYALEAKFRYWTYTWREEPEGMVVTFRTEHLLSSLQDKQLDTIIAAIAEDCRDMDDYDKIKYVYDYLILNAEVNSAKVGIYNNLVGGRSDSGGYADAFLAIMHEVGIPCKYTCNDQHAWNTVCMNGNWYNVDAALGDTGGENINYDFFLKSERDWKGMKPTESTAIASFHATGLNEHAKYPNYKISGLIKSNRIIIIPVIALVVVIFVLNKIRTYSTHYRVARNQKIIENLYRLSDE